MAGLCFCPLPFRSVPFSFSFSAYFLIAYSAMHSGRDSGAPIHKAEKGGMEEEKVGKITIGKKRV